MKFFTLRAYMVGLAVYVLVMSQPIWAIKCTALIESQNETLAFSVFGSPTNKRGQNKFQVEMLDHELGLVEARALSIKKSGLLALGEGIDDPRIKQKIKMQAVRPLIMDMWEKIKDVPEQTVSSSQNITAGIHLKNFKVLSQPERDESQRVTLQKLKDELADLLKNDDLALVDKRLLNRLGFSVSLVMAHVNGKTKPKLTGELISPSGRGVYHDFSMVDQFHETYPSFYSFHPESFLYLISRGIYIWKIALKTEAIDGYQNTEPYAGAMHDGNHFGLLKIANKNTLRNEMKRTFDITWSQFINRPGRTLRLRELAIFVLFDIWFEDAREFSFKGLREGFSALQEKNSISRNYFIQQINSPDSFGSKLIHEQEVTEQELDQTLSELQNWLDKS